MQKKNRFNEIKFIFTDVIIRISLIRPKKANSYKKELVVSFLRLYLNELEENDQKKKEQNVLPSKPTLTSTPLLLFDFMCDPRYQFITHSIHS